MQDNPAFATEVGYPGQNDRWTDQSLEAIARRKAEQQFRLKAIESIDRAKLNSADQLNYDLFRKGVQDAIQGERFKQEYMPMTQLNGVHQDAAQLFDIAPHVSVKDYEDIIARLKGIPALVDQNMALLQKGIESGITPP